jgi:hypothetical protein
MGQKGSLFLEERTIADRPDHLTLFRQIRAICHARPSRSPQGRISGKQRSMRYPGLVIAVVASLLLVACTENMIGSGRGRERLQVWPQHGWAQSRWTGSRLLMMRRGVTPAPHFDTERAANAGGQARADALVSVRTV